MLVGAIWGHTGFLAKPTYGQPVPSRVMRRGPTGPELSTKAHARPACLCAVFCCTEPLFPSFQTHRPLPPTMALLSSASLRTCARPAAAPRAVVVAPRVVVCRAKTQEDALKMAQDMLQKGMDAVKNVDTNQVRGCGKVIYSPVTWCWALDQGCAATVACTCVPTAI